MFYFRWVITSIILLILTLLSGVDGTSLEMALCVPGIVIIGAILSFISFIFWPNERVS